MTSKAMKAKQSCHSHVKPLCVVAIAPSPFTRACTTSDLIHRCSIHHVWKMVGRPICAEAAPCASMYRYVWHLVAMAYGYVGCEALLAWASDVDLIGARPSPSLSKSAQIWKVCLRSPQTKPRSVRNASKVISKRLAEIDLPCACTMSINVSSRCRASHQHLIAFRSAAARRNSIGVKAA